MNFNRKKKILILFLAACIVFSVISAETLIAGEHNHKHNHIEKCCPICVQIEIVKCLLRALNLAGLTVLFAVFHSFFPDIFREINKSFYYMLTPIALKVRFNS